MSIEVKLREYYDAVRAAYLQQDLAEIQRINEYLAQKSTTAGSVEEYTLTLSYLWACRGMESHFLLRTERYGEAIEIARQILEQRNQLKDNSIPQESKTSLAFSAELSGLYTLGTVKWIGPAELENAVMPPAAMLEGWIGALDGLHSLGLVWAETLQTKLRICGQTVIQTGLRYCPASVGEAMARFNTHFDTRLNPVLRDYLSCPAAPDDSYLYWSIELAKVMYNGDMSMAELELLIGRERRALLSLVEPEVDVAYAELAFRSFLPTIARRFCVDFDEASLLKLRLQD